MTRNVVAAMREEIRDDKARPFGSTRTRCREPAPRS